MVEQVQSKWPYKQIAKRCLNQSRTSRVLDLLNQGNATATKFAKPSSGNFQSKERKGASNYDKQFSFEKVLLPIRK